MSANTIIGLVVVAGLILILHLANESRKNTVKHQWPHYLAITVIFAAMVALVTIAMREESIEAKAHEEESPEMEPQKAVLVETTPEPEQSEPDTRVSFTVQGNASEECDVAPAEPEAEENTVEPAPHAPQQIVGQLNTVHLVNNYNVAERRPKQRNIILQETWTFYGHTSPPPPAQTNAPEEELVETPPVPEYLSVAAITQDVYLDSTELGFFAGGLRLGEPRHVRLILENEHIPAGADRVMLHSNLKKLLGEFAEYYQSELRDNNDYDNPDDKGDQKKLREGFQKFLDESRKRKRIPKDWQSWINEQNLVPQISFQLLGTKPSH